MSSNPVDSLVLGGIDAFLPTRPAEKEFMEAVNYKVREAIENKDVRSIVNIGKSLLGIAQVTGIAFSEFVYTVEACWNELKQRDNFFAWAEDEFGRDKATIERHLRIWQMFVSGDVPKEYVDKFKTMPIRVLIPIASMWNQGYEVTDLQWKKLSNAPDPTTVSKLIKEITGKEVREGALNIEWAKEQKSFVGWKDGKPHTISLMYDENDEVCQQMLARLAGGGRTLEK